MPTVPMLIESHPAAASIAEMLGLYTVTRAALPAEAPAVMVVGNEDDIFDVLSLRTEADLVAVIAWELPEQKAVELADAGLTVFYGKPSETEWESFLAGEYDSAVATTMQLAAVESQLAAPRVPFAAAEEGADA